MNKTKVKTVETTINAKLVKQEAEFETLKKYAESQGDDVTDQTKDAVVNCARAVETSKKFIAFNERQAAINLVNTYSTQTGGK